MFQTLKTFKMILVKYLFIFILLNTPQVFIGKISEYIKTFIIHKIGMNLAQHWISI